ncbi:maltase 1-like [Babylonia areolata]|uniref:maltase 1-like n=1 Tax=Babylonia areolata TaxID=304850 RepID=UPI003FD0167C
MAEGGRDLEWWKSTIIYQVYPRSFCDSNVDGIGDLKGITSKMDYFTFLHVGAVWISPFFVSPMADFGYDVADFRDVDPIFGTMQDFEELILEAHKRDIKIIVDFVPNHTSDRHEWFQKSCAREEPYDDFYVWHDGTRDDNGQPQPPNNWLSQFGGSAWRWHEGRGQFYYSAFLAQQPDLNYRNPRVVQEMNDVVRFWLEKGVDGMRVDALDYLFESADVSKDEPRSGIPGVTPPQAAYNKPIHTTQQPEILDIVRGWRSVFDEFQKKDGRTRFMVIETYASPQWRNQYYGAGGNPFNMDLCQLLRPPLSGTKVQTLVHREYSGLPPDGWPTFVLGNHDQPRLSSKVGARYVDVLNMLLLTLRGTPCTYYGEELGLQDIHVTFHQTRDPFGKNFGPTRYKEFSRDPCRAPMQWDSSDNAGFSSSPSPWLPVHPDFRTRNVKVQKESPRQTTLQLYTALARLRQDPVFQQGELLVAVSNGNIFSYVRQLPSARSTTRYLVVLNLGQETSKDDYSGKPVYCIRGVVVHSTCSLIDRMRNGGDVDLTELEMKPGDGVVIRID